MKKIFLIILVSLAFSSLQAQFRSANLTAAGLTCAICTKAINNSLEQLSFIRSVKADIKNSTFKIDFREGTVMDFDQLKSAVEDAGFSVAMLTLTGNFEKVQVTNDAHVLIDGKTFHFLNVSNQTLDGQKTIKLVDKHYVSGKEFRKYAAATHMSCIQTGKAANCCAKDGISPNTRIYHVTI